MGRSMLTGVLAAVAAFGAIGLTLTPAAQDELPRVTRAQMIETARRLAEHAWTCRNVNTRAPCVANYQSDWKADETVTGIAYDWGGMDGPEAFDEKLANGQAAGSHSKHGVTACTAGIDCSGYVGLCWGITRKYGTSTIREISARPRYDWYADMQPGDALNKPGSHIVLFAGYRPDGNPIVYEASGPHGRVIRNDWDTWSRYKGYYPLQYRGVVE